MSAESSWRRIARWCQANAPRTAAWVLPAADAGELAQTIAGFPRGWPSDLRDWYELQDGLSPEAWRHDDLMLGWTVLSLASIRTEARNRIEVPDELFDRDLIAEGEDHPAGTPSPVWLPSFVPIARSVAAGTLCVDTRSGAQTGCLVEWDEEGGGPVIWPSTAAMLDEMAVSLETGTSRRGLTPTVVAGELLWRDDPVEGPADAAMTVSDGWHEVGRVKTEHSVVKWERGEPDPLYINGRDWAWYDIEIGGVIESLRVRMAPPTQWPPGFGERLGRDLAELRRAQAQMAADDKAYFNGLADVLESMLKLQRIGTA
jgi:cell wall assembly regulator SMI1